MALSKNPFALTAQEVERLSADEQVELVNQLIVNRAMRLRIRIDDVRTTLRTDDPDGGIDAIVDTGIVNDELLGHGLSVWQYKKAFPSDTVKTKAKSEVQEELEKPGVQEVFSAGGGYTLVVGRQCVPGGTHGQSGKLKRIQELAANAGCSGTVRLLVADQIATWTNQDPAALLAIRQEIRGLSAAMAEVASPRHRSMFEPDPARTAILDDIGSRLLGPDPVVTHIRIQGQAGVGKSRLALEAVRKFAGSEATFYANETVTNDLFDWVTVQPQAHVTLVIDECEAEEAQRYSDKAIRAGGRIRIITVGPGTSRGLDVHLLDPLDEEAAERIIQAESGLTSERARWIARKTRGYIKLAVLVAKAVAQGTSSVAQLASDFEVSNLVQKLLSPDPRDRRALRGVALLTKLGVDGGVESEGKAIAEFLGMSWNEFRDALGPARRQGIVVKRGRYLYVSPELLATWLAGEVWRDQPERIVEFMAALPSQAAQLACYERLASLSDIPDVERVVADLFGPTGSFQSLGDLSDNLASRLYSTLAKGHPRSALRSLTRIIGGATEDDLRAFKTGRQDVVWTLHRLLERRETFHAAARLLRRLAETENESYFSNNATDYWNKAFLTYLGQTEVAPLERFSLIDEALASNTIAVRLLGISALSSALQWHESASVEGSGESVPPEHWKPRTQLEVKEVKREALERLSPLLTDVDPQVARAARKALRAHGRGLVRLGLAEPVLAAFRGLVVTDEAERRQTWEAIRDISYRRTGGVSAAQREQFEELARVYFDNTLPDRLRRYLGPGSFAKWDEEELANPNRADAIAELAVEALDSTEWIDLLPWLFSGDAHQIYPFALRLGEIDVDRKWFSRLRDAGRSAVDPRLLTVYMAGWGALGPSEQATVEGILDEWSDDARLGGVVADASLRGIITERSINRLLRLVDAKVIEPSFLGWLRTSKGLQAISFPLIGTVFRTLRLDGSENAIYAGLALALSLKEPNGTVPAELRQDVWPLLEAPNGWTDATDYMWTELARSFVEFDVLRVLGVLVIMCKAREPSIEDSRIALLRDVAEQHPAESLDRLTPDPMIDPSRFRFRWALKDVGFFDHINPEVVVTWVRQHGDAAAKALAESINVYEGELGLLVRFLLTNFFEATEEILAAQFLSGGWVGSHSEYLTPKLESARGWTKDPDSAVCKWAAGLCDYIEATIRQSRQREE